jgi:hypothetical protein
MLSALRMLRRVARAMRYAVREEDFLPVLGAGVALVVIGTVISANHAARSAARCRRSKRANSGPSPPGASTSRSPRTTATQSPRFHAAGVDGGYRDNGAPGIRP